MSRLVKFRVWDKQLLKMFDVQSVDTVNEEVVYWSYEKRYSTQGYDMPAILMQYTGLKDINGKEVYEGDIVAGESHGINRFEKRVVCYDSYQAKYKAVPPSAYHANAGNGGFTGYELRGHYEVVGNIYENPELII